MPYTIVRFDRTMLSMLPRAEEPFPVIGRLVPRYDGGAWQLSEELFPEPREKKYPEDIYDPLIYVDSPDRAAFLAMLDGSCVGSIRVCRRWNGNAHIEDIAVDRAHRGRGVGTLLLDAADQWGKDNGLFGVSLETQDNNLLACRFYLRCGFRLGGLDTSLYSAGPYRKETALYFYRLPDISADEAL